MRPGRTGKPIILGHRGFRGPLENTLPAFRRALVHAEGIEFDVRMTRDGKLVVLHDEVFMADGRLYSVGDLTYRELVRLHPLGKLIPRVRDVLRLSPPIINADIKEILALEPLLRELEREGILGRAILSVDVFEWVHRIGRACPDCRVGFSITNARSLFLSLRANSYSIHVPLDLVRYLGFRGFLGLLNLYRRRNLKILLWNYRMNEVELVPRVLGVADGVISDDPARLKRFISPK